MVEGPVKIHFTLVSYDMVQKKCLLSNAKDKVHLHTLIRLTREGFRKVYLTAGYSHLALKG